MFSISKRKARASRAFQPRSRAIVWLLARTWIHKNKDCIEAKSANIAISQEYYFFFFLSWYKNLYKKNALPGGGRSVIVTMFLAQQY